MQTERMARLQAMGIPVWLPRAQATARSEQDRPHTSAGVLPRVRVSAGTGDWLLVTRSPPAAQHARLIEDIVCTIGRERCLFGQWSDNQDSGTALDELAARGIRWVLSLGEPPQAGDFSGLLIAADPETLAHDVPARKTLWKKLQAASADVA